MCHDIERNLGRGDTEVGDPDRRRDFDYQASATPLQ